MPQEFVAQKMWYDNFIVDQQTFNPQNLQFYLNKIIFAQDINYHRFSDLMLSLFQTLFSE